MRSQNIVKLASKFTALPHQDRLKDKFVAPDRAGGGIIANHATGTGKTFSSIHAAHATGKHLVAVVPASLRDNYKKELEASGFTGSADVISYQQALRLRKDPEFVAKARDSVFVYDEAHRMGSETSAASKLPDQFKTHKNLLLTGTPIKNHPTDLVPLLRAVTKDPTVQSVADFRRNYIEEGQVNPGVLARIRGVTPGKVERPKNLEQLAKVLRNVVDTQTSADQADHIPTHSEEEIRVAMSPAQSAAYKAVLASQPNMSYKLRYGVPEGKDFRKYKSFLTGLRQISNTSQEFQGRKGAPGSKILRAADEVMEHSLKVPNYRGYSYSNYLKSGVQPLKDELNRRGMKTEIYSGKLSDAEKKKLVKNYNSGKLKHLLLTSSGAEGLDLKGTKLVQIMEPHWNSSKIHQVKARGIRYKSHAHLPTTERNVHVQHFFSDEKQSPYAKFFGAKPPIYADEAIHNAAKKKDLLNNAFMKVLQNSKND